MKLAPRYSFKCVDCGAGSKGMRCKTCWRAYQQAHKRGRPQVTHGIAVRRIVQEPYRRGVLRQMATFRPYGTPAQIRQRIEREAFCAALEGGVDGPVA